MTLRQLTIRLRHRGLWVFTILAAALVFSACDLVGTDDEEDAQQQAQQQEVEQETAAAATPSPRPAAPARQEPTGPPPPPVASGGGEGAVAYSIVFPSLAHVSIGDAVATGLVISQGFVIVDEAALGGAPYADVLFSNGDTLTALPVVGRDALTGIAYLGPIDSALVRLLPGARVGDGESIRPGSSVFSVGYSQGDASGAMPAIFSGVMSGIFEWTPGDRTLLRTDIGLSQSSAGMILVDASGTVIGVAPAALASSGYYVSTGDLARSLPPAPIASSRQPDPATAATEHLLTIADERHSLSLYLGAEATGQSISLAIASDSAASLLLIDAQGSRIQESNLIAGSTIITLAPDTIGPYEIRIMPAADMDGAMVEDSEAGDDPEAMMSGARFEISSSAPLMLAAEADALAELNLNEPLVATIGVLGDEDFFSLPVRAGAVYEVSARSLSIDSYLVVLGTGSETADDNSGGGPFGSDAALVLEPMDDGIVQIAVSDRSGLATGAYLLTVNQVGGEAPEEAAAMADEETAMMAATLPAPSPPPTISLRGVGAADGLQATLVGLDSQSVGNGLLVDDADGAFEIIVSVIGGDGSLGRLTVTNAQGAVVVEGRVLVSCPSGDQCLAQAIFVGNETAGGPWIVELGADEPGISEWQIEVERHE